MIQYMVYRGVVSSVPAVLQTIKPMGEERVTCGNAMNIVQFAYLAASVGQWVKGETGV